MFQSKGIKYCICQAMMGTLSAWKVCKPCGHASCAQTNNSRAKLASYWTFNWYFHAYIYQTVCGYLPSFTWLRKRKGNAGAARKIYSLTRKIARQVSWLRISIARASSFPAQSKFSSHVWLTYANTSLASRLSTVRIGRHLQTENQPLQIMCSFRLRVFF